MSGVDVRVETTKESSAVPHGMREVSKEEFWEAVMAPGRDVHPSPKRTHTDWIDLRTGQRWGWVSRGFVGPFDYQGHIARFALAGGAA